MWKYILSLLTVLLVTTSVSAQTISPEDLQSVSVKIKTPEGYGSGVVIKRKDSKGKDIWLVWSVGHLFKVEQPYDIFDIFTLKVIPSNTPAIDHASISQNISINGEMKPSGHSIMAKLLKFSPGDKNDIAVLQLEKPFYNNNTATFDLSGRIPSLGETVYNVSAPYGEDGSFSQGVFSCVGRKLDSYVYDQTTCVVYPGSSGGAFFNTNSQVVGLTDIMRAANINYMVPIRRIQAWAKYEHIEWALDPTLPMPTESELKKMTLKSVR